MEPPAACNKGYCSIVVCGLPLPETSIPHASQSSTIPPYPHPAFGSPKSFHRCISSSTHHFPLSVPQTCHRWPAPGALRLDFETPTIELDPPVATLVPGLALQPAAHLPAWPNNNHAFLRPHLGYVLVVCLTAQDRLPFEYTQYRASEVQEACASRPTRVTQEPQAHEKEHESVRARRQLARDHVYEPQQQEQKSCDTGQEWRWKPQDAQAGQWEGIQSGGNRVRA